MKLFTKLVVDKYCRVNLGKNWEKLESDLVIGDKLNFKSDLIFKNGGSNNIQNML